MASGLPVRLAGSEIHGFRTMEDLDISNMMEEAKSRWLRPNEIHAVLCNYKYFTVYVKPVNLPKSGTIVLFDRKMLRNFRKDGHNWKKKKDGKTVKEAHEHLKVGNEERIHVYYAHGEDNPTFVRRCYWLLDKSLEHIVLVHYRETQESSPATPGNSNSSSAASDPSVSWPLSEESDSAANKMSGFQDSMKIKDHQQRLHEINTLEWDQLLVGDTPDEPIVSQGGKSSSAELRNQFEINSQIINGSGVLAENLYPENAVNYFPGPVASSKGISFDVANNISYQMMETVTNVNTQDTVPSLDTLGENAANKSSGLVAVSNPMSFSIPNNTSYQMMEAVRDVKAQGEVSSLGTLGGGESLDYLGDDSLQKQDSFGRWMNYIISDSSETPENRSLESSISIVNQSSTPPTISNEGSSLSEQIFSITDVSPEWALSSEETKVLVVGFFKDRQSQLSSSSLFLVCGNSIFPAEAVGDGILRCLVSPQTPGRVNIYLSFDGHKPISQVLTFEFRAPMVTNWTIPSEDKSSWEVFDIQIRLARLLFSTSQNLNIFSSKVSQNALKEAKVFAGKTSYITDGWAYLMRSMKNAVLSFPQAKDHLFELTLRNRLREWLLERVITASKITERDEQGQGVIHLCAILGYTWAVYPYSWSGLSLDFRDKRGWTALHWAASCGREKMVATLLSAGAKPNLVADPTPEYPGGCTAADLASKNGHEGLGAYLAEKSLVAHFEAMTLAGNVSGSLQTTTTDFADAGNFNEEELYLKDTLAAYRTAADAAARIQAAFREHSFNVRTKAVQSSSPEQEARNIVAAMKIQHAYRNYESRKKLAAAARIQYRFRTWKMRKEFLNMRRQAIKIQSIFRGYQVRKHYKKIVWSVGVLEKAILRWRLKRKGFRGLQVSSDVPPKDENQESDVEEDFFQASRKQAEERVERSVVRVQAMFRSKRAQEEYRRMKLAYNEATLEYEGLLHPDVDMR